MSIEANARGRSLRRTAAKTWGQVRNDGLREIADECVSNRRLPALPGERTGIEVHRMQIDDGGPVSAFDLAPQGGENRVAAVLDPVFEVGGTVGYPTSGVLNEVDVIQVGCFVVDEQPTDQSANEAVTLEAAQQDNVSTERFDDRGEPGGS